ncbi:MAG TPA: NADH-quinone oxidoreductase subunit C [Acidimicrobiales bacterium]|nr:NADH-quinone oxidoreductase subunit C [Acidimicrobiales bacterium]
MADASDTAEGTVAEAETDEARQHVLDDLTGALGDAVVGSHIVPGRGLWVRVTRDAWVTAAEVAKLRLGFTFFDFLSGIDWMPSPWGRYEDSTVDDGVTPFDPTALVETGLAGGDTRFQVMCRLASVRPHPAPHLNVVLKVDVPDDDLRLDSLVRLYGGANWHERECWEMFGITFDGHPGLRHLYLPGEFEGHPLRKDFPLLARLVKPWPGIVDVEPMPGEAASGDTGDNGDGAGDAEGGDT